MTVTETPATATRAPAASPAERIGFAALVGTGDPRRLGALYIGTSVLFMLAAGVLGGLLGIERIDLDSVTVLEDSLLQTVSIHAVGGLFLFVVPLLIGIMAAVVPLQIGAPTVAFPRALAASYWGYLVCGALVVASYAMNGGPYGGDADGVDLFLASFAALLVALSVAAVVLVTTVITLRAPGMTLRRTPLFAWSTLVGGIAWLFVLPVLAGITVLLYLDERYGRLFIGSPDVIYDRIEWVFHQPTLYVFAVPALGIIGDVVPVFARRRHVLHAVAMTAVGLFAALGIGTWTQVSAPIDPGRGATTPWLYDPVWVAVGLLAVLPMVILLVLWGDTLRRGSIRLASPLLFALAALAMLLVGVSQGAIGVWEDLELTGAWYLAQAHYVLLGVAIAGAAGVAFWAPKIYGVRLAEGAARLAATLLLLGTIGLAFPDLIAGIIDDEPDTIDALNAISAAGGAIAILGAVLLALLLLGAAMRTDPTVGDDPWDGHTLEWTTSSPPPVGNFAGVMAITSEAPLYDARYGGSASAAADGADA
jgi:heme/copper-type cytochrome/quinol oxidase subunit 1